MRRSLPCVDDSPMAVWRRAGDARGVRMHVAPFVRRVRLACFSGQVPLRAAVCHAGGTLGGDAGPQSRHTGPCDGHAGL